MFGLGCTVINEHNKHPKYQINQRTRPWGGRGGNGSLEPAHSSASRCHIGAMGISNPTKGLTHRVPLTIHPTAENMLLTANEITCSILDKAKEY